jgi:hypothetical protein
VSYVLRLSLPFFNLTRVAPARNGYPPQISHLGAKDARVGYRDIRSEHRRQEQRVPGRQSHTRILRERGRDDLGS